MVALYFVAIIIALAVPQLRRTSGVRILLILTALSFTLLMCLQKNWYYLIFIIPYYTAILAIVCNWLWRRIVRVDSLAVVSLLGIVYGPPSGNRRLPNRAQ